MLNPKKVALALGSFVALVHVAWSLLVLLKWAQPLHDFVARIHFIQPFATVLPFDFGTAVELVIIAALIGALVGYVFATVWNKVAKR